MKCRALAALCLAWTVSLAWNPGISRADSPRPPAIDPTRTALDPLAPVSGGLTANQVGERAAAASYQVESSRALADAASSRSTQALSAFLPRINVLFKLAELSNVDEPGLLNGTNTNLVLTTSPVGTINPKTVVAANPAIPTLTQQGLLDANVIVPVSDYFLRISHNYTAATNIEEAAKYDLVAAKSKSYADGMLAYYGWVLARGGLLIAQQTLTVSRLHARDTEVGNAIGSGSKADMLRARAGAAAAEVQVARSTSSAALAERQVRLAIHAKPDDKIDPGETLDRAAPGMGDLNNLIATATRTRPELKSLDRNAEAFHSLASAARASYVPSLSAFADALYADPNPRVFPPTSTWVGTWSVGAQLAWAPTDILGGAAAVGDSEARAAAFEAQRKAARDGIELEVVQAYNSVTEADTSVEASERELDSALEAYRTSRELYSAGHATSTALFDAEDALARARFERLRARVDARTARVRLAYATGTTLGSR